VPLLLLLPMLLLVPLMLLIRLRFGTLLFIHVPPQDHSTVSPSKVPGAQPEAPPEEEARSAR
jgi:hypothetical protein